MRTVVACGWWVIFSILFPTLHVFMIRMWAFFFFIILGSYFKPQTKATPINKERHISGLMFLEPTIWQNLGLIFMSGI